jgi:hypothetical protein
MDTALWYHRTYHDAGATLAGVEHLEDVPAEALERLKGGEVFTLLDGTGKPHRRLLLDQCGKFRTSAIDCHGEQEFFSIPPSPYAC